MKKLWILTSLMAGSYFAPAQPPKDNNKKISIPLIVVDAEQQTKTILSEIGKVKRGELVSPRTVDKGELKLVPSKDWTSGFSPVCFGIYMNVQVSLNGKPRPRPLRLTLKKKR